MIPAVPPFFSAPRSWYRALHAELFVHSRYRSRPARPTHAFALQPRRSGASSAIPATDFHQPSALYAAFRAYYSPSPRFNCRVSYHRPPTVSTKSAGSRVPTLHNRSLRATARSWRTTPRPLRATPRSLRAQRGNLVAAGDPRSIQRDRHVVALLAMTKRVRVRKCGLRRATAFGN